MKRPLNPSTLELLSRQDWGKVLLELEAAIIQILRVHGGPDSLPRGLEPRDIAISAIGSLYTGDRTWDYEKYPNVGKFLYFSIVRSQLSHLFSSKDYKLISRLGEISAEQDDYSNESSAQVEQGQSKELLSFEEEFLVQDLVDKIISGLGADKTAKEVFQLKMLGCKDLEMSQRLEISVGDVRAASKRIARVGKRLLPKER